MKPTMYINEWQCSINILNATVYRKFQHASLHNPIKNTAFTLPKKNSTFREKNDHNLFKNSTQYKLPTVRTYRKKLSNIKLIQGSKNKIILRKVKQVVQPKSLFLGIFKLQIRPIMVINIIICNSRRSCADFEKIYKMFLVLEKETNISHIFAMLLIKFAYQSRTPKIKSKKLIF